MRSFRSILVANRGEIACRILRTARELGYRTVAVYSEADADSLHLTLADEAVCIGPAPAAQSYLNSRAIIDAAHQVQADAIHPGYGFLSENADFALACAEANLTFIGPSVEAIALMGSKRRAKIAMLAAGVPCIPGYEGEAQDDQTLAQAAERIGYPVMIKASAGGGGRGMRLVSQADTLLEHLRSARSEALNAFGSDELILEKALQRPRHVEIQIMGDHHGGLLHLGERDCSIQRRHQKVIEESPCPVMTPELRRRMGEAAIKAAASVAYQGAGTVEFMLDDQGHFYFLEMNTRLQVEHPVTELVTGLDLVAWQIRIAEGQPLPLSQPQVALRGHAIEARLYAEDSRQNFMPQTGQIQAWVPAALAGVRIDHGLQPGQRIGAFYDPMLAKITAHGDTREQARARLILALEHSILLGVIANQRFLLNLLRHPAFIAGDTTTDFIAETFAGDSSLQPQPPSAQALATAAALFYQNSAQHYHAAGWSNSAPLPCRLQLEQAGQVYCVEVCPKALGPTLALSVTAGQTQFELGLGPRSDGQQSIHVNRIRTDQAWRLHGERLWLHGPDGPSLFERATQSPVSASIHTDQHQLLAPMDGAVIALLVAPGDPVREGQILLLVDAMKMEHPLKAPFDGQIERIQVTTGTQVRRRQCLIEMAPSAGASTASTPPDQ